VDGCGRLKIVCGVIVSLLAAVGTLVSFGCRQATPDLSSAESGVVPRAGFEEAGLLEAAVTTPADPRIRTRYLQRARLHTPLREVELLEAAVARMPKSDELWARLAAARCRAGQFKAAENAAQRALKLNPQNVEAGSWLGVAALSRGAGQDLVQALPPTRENVARGLVMLWPDVGKEALLRSAVEKLLRGLPGDGRELRMEAALAAGDTKEAQALSQALLRERPGCRRALIVQGVLRLEAGDMRGAREAFLAAGPEQSMARSLGIASCEVRQGKTSAALRTAARGGLLDASGLAEILSIRTMCAYPNRRAMWELLRSQVEAAKAALAQDRAALACLEGMCSYFLGDEVGAANRFRHATALQPGVQPAADYLAGHDLLECLATVATTNTSTSHHGQREPSNTSEE